MGFALHNHLNVAMWHVACGKIVTLAPPNFLSLGNAQIHLAFLSLIRTFAIETRNS